MREFLALTMEVPVWLIILLVVVYGVGEWASGYEKKLTLKLYELSKEDSNG